MPRYLHKGHVGCGREGRPSNEAWPGADIAPPTTMNLNPLPFRIGLLGLLLLAPGPLTAQDSLPARLQPVITRLRALAAAEWAYNDRWDLFTDDLSSLTLDPPGAAVSDSVALLVTFANASGWIALGWTKGDPYRQCVMFGGYGDPPTLPDPPATSAGTLAVEPDVPACDD